MKLALDADPGAGSFLIANVNLTGRVVADEDGGQHRCRLMLGDKLGPRWPWFLLESVSQQLFRRAIRLAWSSWLVFPGSRNINA